MALGALTLARAPAQEKNFCLPSPPRARGSSSPATTKPAPRRCSSSPSSCSSSTPAPLRPRSGLLARARARAAQSGPAGRRRRRPPAPAAPGLLAVFSQRLRTRPNIPLTAAPHGVGCEVTRGDPGGGGGALSRRSSGVFPLLDRILGASTTSPPPSRPTYPFPLTARPPHPLQQVARARFARERPRLWWRPAAASRGEAVPPSRLTAGRPRHRLEGGRRAAPPSSLPPPLPPSP